MVISPLKPITACSGGDDFETVTNRCFEVSQATAKLGLVNSHSYYCTFIDRLLKLENTRICSMASVGSSVSGTDRVIALRHDVDADPISAIACAEHLRQSGVTGAFYLLHTSHYYGVFDSQEEELVFTRHDAMPTLLASLTKSGCEIGLHNDVLGVAFDHAADGVAALCIELSWLRGQGVEVSGSAAHNSAAVYGAECFEIFDGLASGGRRSLEWQGKSLALQAVSMNELGLSYEANHPIPRSTLDHQSVQALSAATGDVLRNPDWQERYFIKHPVFARGYDYDAWLVGKDTWLLAGAGRVLYPLTLDQVIFAFETLPAESRTVVSIHPIYVGLRDESFPTL